MTIEIHVILGIIFIMCCVKEMMVVCSGGMARMGEH